MFAGRRRVAVEQSRICLCAICMSICWAVVAIRGVCVVASVVCRAVTSIAIRVM